MNVLEASFLEELVSGVGQVVSDARNRRDQLSAASQMSLRSEEFSSVFLLGKRVLVSRSGSEKLDHVGLSTADLKLEWLSFFRTADKLACSFEGGSNFSVFHFVKVGHLTGDNDLERALATSVVQLNEEKAFSTKTGGTCPS